VSDIAREAGIASGTIYLYFRTKDEILVTLFREKMAEETAIAGVAHLEAQTTELKARAEAYLSEKIKTNRELRKEENLQEAMKEYEKEGRDINNVKPELRSYLIDFARKEQDSQRALLSTLVTSAEKARESGDTESANRANTAAQETLGRIQALSRISDIFSNADVSKLPKPMPGEPTGLDSAAAFKAVGEYRKVYGNDPTFVAQKMLENGFTLPETTSAAPPPAATAPPFAQSLIANPAKKIAQKLSSMPAETMLQNVRD
jgi:AcrR family transcriptional regulator